MADLNKKSQASFVSLDRVLLTITNALYGEEKSLPKKGSEEFHEVWNVLRHSLQTDDVRAIWFNDAMESKRLPIDWAAAEFFHLDNHNPKLAHLPGPNYPVLLEVNIRDLNKFLADEDIYTPKKTISAQKRCQELLEELFRSGGPVPAKNQLFDQMRDRIPGLSKSAFFRAREEAIVITKRFDLRKPGRPRVVAPDPK